MRKCKGSRSQSAQLSEYNIQQLAKNPTWFWIALTAIHISVGDH